MSYKEIPIKGELAPEMLMKGTFLWVIHADKIPPHVGLSVNGVYFSLKANGLDLNIDCSSMLRVINKKKIKTLFYHLTSVNIDAANAVFKKFSHASAGEVTCLQPIKELANSTEARSLHELLDDLLVQDQIGDCFGLNLGENFEGIKDYTVDDIHKRLNSLNG